MKRVGMFLAAAMLVGMAWTSSANAAASFFKVTIDMIGMANATVLVMRLSDTAADPAFTNKPFRHTGAITKEMLAIALTAFSVDSPVRALTDPLAGSTPEVFRMLIEK